MQKVPEYAYQLIINGVGVGVTGQTFCGSGQNFCRSQGTGQNFCTNGRSFCLSGLD